VRNILVIRFGSLGDLCLLGWSLARLGAAAGHPDRRVTLVTKQAFAPLMASVHGVDQVVALEDQDLGGLLNLAGRLRGGNWDTIIDAHDILRGHGLLTLLGRRPDRRIRKDTAQRLALLRGAAATDSLERTMRHRFDELVEGLVEDLPETGPAPLAHLADRAPTDRVLGLAPGAQWDAKRWPEENFAELLTDFRKKRPTPVRVFLGPREERWFAGSKLEAVAASLPDVTVLGNRSLTEIATHLAGCSALVTNDSGLLHLAEAVGTPVLAFFGPTVRQFGYFPCLPESRVLEVELDCRPCSRNGKRACHRKDLACLRQISPGAAGLFLDRMFPV
jgi:heptosyltransferase-2